MITVACLAVIIGKVLDKSSFFLGAKQTVGLWLVQAFIAVEVNFGIGCTAANFYCGITA